MGARTHEASGNSFHYTLLRALAVLLLSLAFLILGGNSSHAAELNLGAMVQPVPLDSKFASSNYYQWCGSAVKGDDGRYHLFYARWPESNPNNFAPGWAIVSEVAYAIGDSPRGPFTHVNVVLPKRGTNVATGQKFWDADMTHNPYCIRKDGKWWLYYLGNYGDGTYNNHLNHDRIGVAVADNPAGPWTRLDQPIVDVSTNAADFDSLRLANPAVTIRPDGKILMIYKAVTAASGNAVRFGACIADSPTNTYVKQAAVAGQIFKAAGGDWMVAEDPFIWFSPNYDNQYYAVVRDVVGTFTGAAGGLALFKSQDGLNWTNAASPAVLGTSFKWANGSNSLSRVERPWVLLENNEPTVLFGATDGYDPGGRISYNVQIPLQPLPASTPPVVTWTSPGANALGSMPLGNGDLTLNAWCETNGDLLFYIGKSDSWEDNSRLAKLGKVRVKLNPPLAPATSAFVQTLNPLRGEMTVTVTSTNSGATSLKVWADANNPVVHVQVNAPTNVTATASFELWRTNSAALASIEASDVNYDTSQPNNMHAPTVVEPDTVLTNLTDGVGWYHRNGKSVGPNETMAFQDLLGAPSYVDPILGRTFGCLLRGPGFVRANDQTIVSSNATSHRFDIYALTKFPATSNEWLSAIRTAVTNTEAVAFTNRYDAHVAWWSEFWDRSYIEITARTNAADPAAATDVATAYALQRFVTACAGRGNYPIKFNGSTFAMPWSGKPGDADYRRWGGGYWWQNTRLPYAGLCTSGDFDLLPSLYRMYVDDVLPLSLYRTEHYFGFTNAAYFTEVTYPWGAVFPTSYGWTTPAASRPPGDGKLQTGGWHKREWVGALELTFMMQDYYDHTGDTQFLTNRLLKTALPVVRWFDRYYTNLVGGKLNMSPSQALETWWTCANAMPEVAGLQAVVTRLLTLPTNLVSASDRIFLTNLQAKLPEIPTRVVSGTTMLAPAQSYASKNNSELPEQYAVYPFRLCSFEKTNAAWGVAAYDAASSGDKGANGWRQDDIFLAYLGLADRAKTNVISRARNKDVSCRFPAFFGPNFDWTPDQCHGGVLMKAVQAMLLQSEGDQIFLLPAWPKEWDVKFKLRAPKQTTVEGVVRNGILVSYAVTPQSRYFDVQVSTNFVQPFAGTPVSGYHLAWSDEFDGATFDTSKWDYRTDSKHWSTQLPANLTVSNGILNLNLKKETAGGMSYTGAGAISRAAFRFGYYEARMRTPPGRGWHTSFWMMKHDGSGGTGAGATALELDCIENDSLKPWSYGVNTHRWNPTPHVTYGGKTVNAPTNGPSLTQDFHIYGCEYTPTAIKYFFDGALVQSVDATTLPQGDLNIWLTSIASHLGGTTNVDDTQLPAVAQFDYARFFSADTNTAFGVSVNILSPSAGGATLSGTNSTLRALAAVITDDPAPVIAWTKVSGPGVVTFGNDANADTTAKFSAPGIYTLQCAATVTGNSTSARVSVNMLAPGVSGTNASVQLRQGVNGYSHLATFIRQDTQTWNAGARDQILVGKFNNGGFRILLSYDLSALPTNALITGAQLDLMTHNSQAGAGTLGALELHPLTNSFVEGTGDGSSATNGAGTGATWASRTGGTGAGDLWTNPGGDFATNILAAAPGISGATTSLPINFAMSSALGADAQFATGAGQPWNLMLSSPATEAGVNGIFARICSDDHATLANRPLLTLSFDGNFAPVAVCGPAPAATNGIATSISGTVSNASGSLWSVASGPSVAVFGDESQLATTVTFSSPGQYVLHLTASNQLAQVADELTMLVASASNSIPYQAAITFTNYERAEVLTNFPALVVLGTNIPGFSYGTFISPVGADLRFTSGDGATSLNYEIERWNPAGSSFVWVQVPQFSNNVAIRARWGDALDLEVFPGTTNGATWSESFLGVWHLAETSGPHYDAAMNYPTSRLVSVTQQGTAAGIAGGCDNFNGAGNYVSLPDLGLQGAITVECWANLNGTPGGADIGLVSSDPWSTGYTHFKVNSAFQVKAAINGGGAIVSSSNLVSAGNWFHAAYTIAGGASNDLKLYVNSVLAGSATGAASNNLSDVNLAREFNGRYLNARLDELRISSVARSSNWLRATYQNLAASGAFVSYGPAAPVTPAAPQLGAFSFSGGQFQFQVNGAADSSYTVQASTNLLTWTSLLTTNPLAMPFGWSDAGVTNFNQRFYRVLMGP